MTTLCVNSLLIYVCRSAEMKLKLTTTKGFNLRIINSLMKSWGVPLTCPEYDTRIKLNYNVSIKEDWSLQSSDLVPWAFVTLFCLSFLTYGYAKDMCELLWYVSYGKRINHSLCELYRSFWACIHSQNLIREPWKQGWHALVTHDHCPSLLRKHQHSLSILSIV